MPPAIIVELQASRVLGDKGVDIKSLVGGHGGVLKQVRLVRCGWVCARYDVNCVLGTGYCMLVGFTYLQVSNLSDIYMGMSEH